ncbi:hypothetical protein BSFA1_22060 [Burkholderia sp. SFA1]|nr:hypothetical protein BSFA1_22060 [Burkholderia sp. SFA1]
MLLSYLEALPLLAAFLAAVLAFAACALILQTLIRTRIVLANWALRFPFAGQWAAVAGWAVVVVAAGAWVDSRWRRHETRHSGQS